jgi:hypothetical protein
MVKVSFISVMGLSSIMVAGGMLAGGCLSANEDADRQPPAGASEALSLGSVVVPEELYIGDSGRLWAIDSVSGGGYILNDDQANPDAMAALGTYVFEVLDDAYFPNARLMKVDLKTGHFTELTPGLNWAGTEAIAALGSYLYIVKADTLWRVSATTGAVAPYSDYPDAWAGTEAMAAAGDGLYVAQLGSLYRVNVNTGSVVAFSDYPNDWAGTEAMAAIGDGLYVAQQGSLWKTNIGNGSLRGNVTSFSDYPNDWAGTNAMAARNGAVYAVQVGALWRISTSTGGVVQLGGLSWTGTTGMATR